MKILLDQWNEIERKAAKAKPSRRCCTANPELAVRVIREEFNPDYRGVVIDDRRLYEDVKAVCRGVQPPELADRIEFYDNARPRALSLFERHHIHEQVHKALDRKVWLPSGRFRSSSSTPRRSRSSTSTPAKNVGKSNLEQTVFHNNMEAAEEVAKQLRLRDIGGIIVIDFIDMEIKENRQKVVTAFREALARDKTRTQVFDISEVGTGRDDPQADRRRGFLTEFSETCPDCEGRGVLHRPLHARLRRGQIPPWMCWHRPLRARRHVGGSPALPGRNLIPPQ